MLPRHYKTPFAMRAVGKKASMLIGGLLFCLLWSLPSLGAPVGRITGRVVDADTGESLPGANVRLAGTSIGTAADIDGRYSIAAVPAGTQTLIVSYVGYRPQERQVDVADGFVQEVNFELVWEGIEGGEVVITAQAEGQIAAINQQLASNTITNIVSAARIQELPDVNAAESVGRLPGVSIQRSGGEATRIAIRGLSPKYNTVTVNGVRVPATGGDDRSVDLSLISSNMLDGIEVMKAITPDKDADAIGGSVDLKLRNAPDKFTVDVLAQGGYNQLQDYYGNYKFAATVSNRFLDGKVGVIANLNADEYDRSADKFSANWRQSENPETGEDVLIISSDVLREETVKRGRAGASLVLDYQIPNGTLTANTFYNRLNFEGLYRINNLDVNGNRHYYDTEDRDGTTSIFTGAFGIEQDFNRFRYDASISRTASQSENPDDFTWRFAQEGAAFDIAVDEFTLPTEVQEGAVIDTNTTGLADYYIYSTMREENETAAQLNVQMPFRLGDQVTGYVKAGGKMRWLDRVNDENQIGRGGIYYGSGAGNLNPPLECMDAVLPELNLDEIVGEIGRLPIWVVDSDYSRDDFLDGDYDVGLVADLDMLHALTEAARSDDPLCEGITRELSIGTYGRDYDGTEQYQAGYLMAEFNLGRRIRVIPGVRWEGDQSEYNGQRYREVTINNTPGPPGDFEEITNERDNSFWLPMVHVQFKPTDWLDIRLARTETLTRPDYIQYAPITTINVFRTYVRAANGLLKPAEATNYDIAVSVYNNKVGLFAVTGFTKSISDLILPVSYRLHPDVGPLPGMNVPEEWIADRPNADTYINNPFDAEYRGFELDWQTTFWYLPSVFKGLVLNANYTFLESETTYQSYFIVDSDSLLPGRPPRFAQELKTDSVRTARMPDQPTHIANVTLGYDYKGFSARFSVLYQTDNSIGINPTNALFDSFSDDYLRLDLSVRQKLRNGVELFANFNNLNSRPDRNFLGSSDLAASTIEHPTYIEYYGFTTDIGARYRF